MSLSAFKSQWLLIVLVLISSSLIAQQAPDTEPSVVAVGKAMPAVVNINTERVIKRTLQDPYDTLFYDFFGGSMRPPRQLHQKLQSLGSGFIVDAAGYIVTNAHVVERAADLKIQVTMGNGKTYSAKYIAGDSEADIAFIKIDSPEPLPFISLDDISPNLLGQTVLALGNPLGYGSSVSRGILSALNRNITINDIEIKDLLQTDAAINPGNSGGPLIDLSGRLVGVNSVKMAYTPQGIPAQGLGFAIPAGTVRDKVATFKRAAKGETVAKQTGSKPAAGRLFGLHLQDLTEELTEAFDYKPGMGVLIADVEKGSPAEKAGFERGLVVFKLGEYEIKDSKQVERLLENVESGTNVEFVVGIIRRIGGQYVQQVQSVTLTARG